MPGISRGLGECLGLWLHQIATSPPGPQVAPWFLCPDLSVPLTFHAVCHTRRRLGSCLLLPPPLLAVLLLLLRRPPVLHPQRTCRTHTTAVYVRHPSPVNLCLRPPAVGFDRLSVGGQPVGMPPPSSVPRPKKQLSGGWGLHGLLPAFGACWYGQWTICGWVRVD